VLINIELFWAGVRDLKQLGLLTRTCKTLRAECDVGFAVRAMGKDGNVKKIWAKRWLGLVDGWMRTSAKLTLCLALKIAYEHGGLKMASRRAVLFRMGEENVAAAKRARLEREEKRVQLELLISKRSSSIYSMLNSYDIHDSFFCLHDSIREAARNTSVAIDDNLLARLKAKHQRHLQKALDMEERVKNFDLRMQQKNFPLTGFYYKRMKRCLRRSCIKITDDDIALIGFKDAVSRTWEFSQIVRELTESFGGKKFKGKWFAKAQKLFCERFEISSEGTVLKKAP
jgi:hypothetical protein